MGSLDHTCMILHTKPSRVSHQDDLRCSLGEDPYLSLHKHICHSQWAVHMLSTQSAGFFRISLACFFHMIMELLSKPLTSSTQPADSGHSSQVPETSPLSSCCIKFPECPRTRNPGTWLRLFRGGIAWLLFEIRVLNSHLPSWSPWMSTPFPHSFP